MASGGKTGKAGSFWQRLIGRSVERDEALTAGASPAASDTAPPPDLANTATSGLRDFDIGVEIGRGAMAIVYKATKR